MEYLIWFSFKWSFFAHLFDLLFVYDGYMRFYVPYERLNAHNTDTNAQHRQTQKKRIERENEEKKAKKMWGDIEANQTTKAVYSIQIE